MNIDWEKIGKLKKYKERVLEEKRLT